MNSECLLRIPARMMQELHSHLFSNAGEHAAVIEATYFVSEKGHNFLATRLHLAKDGIDFVLTDDYCYSLKSSFVRDRIWQCRENRTAYFAVHNHGGKRKVAFSGVDIASHESSAPSLLQIADGMPVGWLVFAEQAVVGDIWFQNGSRKKLSFLSVSGKASIKMSDGHEKRKVSASRFDRQIKIFGKAGQSLLAKQKVGIIGLGGVGSLLNQTISRLGVKHIVAVDPDVLEESNLPRVIGSSPSDIGKLKTDIAKRVALEFDASIKYEDIPLSVNDTVAAESLIDCDFIFLAADTAHAMLTANSIAHQYLIPTWQIGTNISTGTDGEIADIYSCVRTIIPGETCLWCSNKIKPHILAEEANPQIPAGQNAYGTETMNPSVIALNETATSLAANEYMLLTTLAKHDDTSVSDTSWWQIRPYALKRGGIQLTVPNKNKSCRMCDTSLGAGRIQQLEGIKQRSIQGEHHDK